MQWLKEHKWIIVATVLAFIVRLVLIYFNPRGTFLENTGIEYLAQSIAQGHGYGYAAYTVDDHSTYQAFWGYPPGTAAIFALMYKVFGLTLGYNYADPVFTYTRVFQSLIDSFGCVLIYLICRELFNKRIGIIASSIYAIFLPIAFMSTWVAHDALMPFLTLAALYCFVLGVKRKVQPRAGKFYALSGLCIGLSCYFQPTTILLPFMFGLAYFVYYIRQEKLWLHFIHTFKVTITILVVMIVVILPWTIRNTNITGTFTPMRSCMWVTLYCGLAEFGDMPNGAVLDDQAELQKAWTDVGHRFDWASKEYEEYFTNKTVEFVKEYPSFVAYTVARRIPRGIIYKPDMGISNYQDDPEFGTPLADGIPSNEYLQQYPQLSQLPSMIGQGKLLSYITTYPKGATITFITLLYITLPVLLAGLGLWFYRKRWRLLVLICTVPLYYFLVSIFILTINAKNKVPGLTGYIILSSLAIYWIFSKVTRKPIDKP